MSSTLEREKGASMDIYQVAAPPSVHAPAEPEPVPAALAPAASVPITVHSLQCPLPRWSPLPPKKQTMSMEEEVKLERKIVAYRDEHQVAAHAHAQCT